MLGLACICTGLAFIVFFRLIDEVGPARAGLITFANPVVALALGAVFLDERITTATLIGFLLVIETSGGSGRRDVVPGRSGDLPLGSEV